MGIYQQILAGKIAFPRYFERSAKLFIKGLLKIDTTKRLGTKFPGVALLKGHKWLATEPDAVDWDAMKAKTPVAPIIPDVKDDTDTITLMYPESATLHLHSMPTAWTRSKTFDGFCHWQRTLDDVRKGSVAMHLFLCR